MLISCFSYVIVPTLLSNKRSSFYLGLVFTSSEVGRVGGNNRGMFCLRIFLLESERIDSFLLFIGERGVEYARLFQKSSGSEYSQDTTNQEKSTPLL